MIASDYAFAHASNQAFVPLLPTNFYISAGVLAVALTVVLLAIPSLGKGLSTIPDVKLVRTSGWDFSSGTSLAFFAMLIFLVYTGMTGSNDPLVNPLPLFIWTVFWIGLVCLQAIVGDLWYWLNPWMGPYNAFCRIAKWDAPFSLPTSLQVWPAIISFLLFAVFMLASLSPEDPTRLAVIVSIYWIVTFVGMLIFGGNDWLKHFECFTRLMNNFSRLSVFGVVDGRLRIGVPGWKLKHLKMNSVAAGLFVVVVFASSSFDGLNETFWWLDFLGINPLEFPGRSAVFWQTIGGLLIFNVLMIVLFSAFVFLGLKLIGEEGHFFGVFFRLAVCVIPIAVAYHIAHFLTTFLVNIQYSLAAASDPWADGSDYLGLGTFYVTTGFFNTLDSVRVIFLTQVIVIVLGHLISIVAAHAEVMRLFDNHKKAVLCQIPLATFMVAYTFFGLWLLAAPRGA